MGCLGLEMHDVVDGCRTETSMPDPMNINRGEEKEEENISPVKDHRERPCSS